MYVALKIFHIVRELHARVVTCSMNIAEDVWGTLWNWIHEAVFQIGEAGFKLFVTTWVPRFMQISQYVFHEGVGGQNRISHSEVAFESFEFFSECSGRL